MVVRSRLKSAGTKPNFFSVNSSARISSGVVAFFTRFLRNSLTFSLVIRSQGTACSSFKPEMVARSEAMPPAWLQSSLAWGDSAGAGAAPAHRAAARASEAATLGRNRFSPNRPRKKGRGDNCQHASHQRGGPRPEPARQGPRRQAAERAQAHNGHAIHRHDAAAVFVENQSLDRGVRGNHLPKHTVPD